MSNSILLTDQATLDRLQQIALTLEVVGISLLVIEIYFPKFATLLVGRYKKGALYLDRNRKFFKRHYCLFCGISWLIFGCIYFYGLYIEFASDGWIRTPLSYLPEWLMISYFFFSPIVLIFFIHAVFWVPRSIIFKLSHTYDLVVRLGRGGVLAGLGLLLASWGIMIELVQVINLCATSGCYGL